MDNALQMKQRKCLPNRALLVGFVVWGLWGGTLNAKPLPQNLQAFKKAHLAELKQPDMESEDLWSKMIDIAIQYHDDELMDRIFGVDQSLLDGYISTNYDLHLIKVFKSEPAFFLHSADRFFQHKLDRVLGFIVNEADEMPLSSVEKTLSKIPGSSPDRKLADEFLELARKKDRRIRQTNRKVK